MAAVSQKTLNWLYAALASVRESHVTPKIVADVGEKLLTGHLFERSIKMSIVRTMMLRKHSLSTRHSPRKQTCTVCLLALWHSANTREGLICFDLRSHNR